MNMGCVLSAHGTHSVDPIAGEGSLSLSYASEEGEIVEETFDLVVLSVGMEVGQETVALAQRLGVELNAHNFARTETAAPVSTSRPGVYACGLFQGPKDIPYAVMEASAAACGAAHDLTTARGSLVREAILPAARDLSGEAPTHWGLCV